jgi:signal transduction histidine kinase
VRLVYTPEAGTPQVLADPRLIEQVLDNLMDNALQAMPAGGHLSLAVTTLSRGTSGRVVEVCVADTGPGMDEATLLHVFDPYFTTKPGGTGLGLAICKRLVTVMRGAIRADSFPGTGSMFIVTLPEFTEQADDGGADSAPLENP